MLGYEHHFTDLWLYQALQAKHLWASPQDNPNQAFHDHRLFPSDLTVRPNVTVCIAEAQELVLANELEQYIRGCHQDSVCITGPDHAVYKDVGAIFLLDRIQKDERALLIMQMLQNKVKRSRVGAFGRPDIFESRHGLA